MLHLALRTGEGHTIDRRICIAQDTQCLAQFHLASMVDRLADEQNHASVLWRLLTQKIDRESKPVNHCSTTISWAETMHRVADQIEIRGKSLDHTRLRVELSYGHSVLNT